MSNPLRFSSQAGHLYGALQKAHEMAARASEDAFAPVNALPLEMRQKIYAIIGAMPPEESVLPKLQRAIGQIAQEALAELPTEQREELTKRVRRYKDAGMGGGSVAGLNAALLMSLEDYYSHIPSEVAPILRKWVAEAPPNERSFRESSLPDIVDFLLDEKRTDLDLSYQNLSALPPIFELSEAFATRLQNLDVSGNKLEALPEELWRLPSLERVSADHNQLQTLSEQVFNHPTLQWLDLSFNQLSTLPKGPQALSHKLNLELQDNPILKGDPKELLQLPQGCVIYLYERDFPLEAYVKVKEALEGSEAIMLIPVKKIKPTADYLQNLFACSGIPAREFPQLMGQKHLQEWLDECEGILKSLPAERQKELAAKIVNYLDLAERDPLFCDRAFSILEKAAPQFSRYSVALALVRLDLAYKLFTIDPKDMHKLAQFLIRQIFFYQQLEESAREKLSHLKSCDEDEIYLAYFAALQDQFDLPLDLKALFFSKSSPLLEQDFSLIEEKITSLRTGRDDRYDYLLQFPEWEAALALNFPREFKAIQRRSPDAPDGSTKKQKKLELTRKVIEPLSIFTDEFAERGERCQTFEEIGHVLVDALSQWDSFVAPGAVSQSARLTYEEMLKSLMVKMGKFLEAVNQQTSDLIAKQCSSPDQEILTDRYAHAHFITQELAFLDDPKFSSLESRKGDLFKGKATDTILRIFTQLKEELVKAQIVLSIEKFEERAKACQTLEEISHVLVDAISESATFSNQSVKSFYEQMIDDLMTKMGEFTGKINQQTEEAIAKSRSSLLPNERLKARYAYSNFIIKELAFLDDPKFKSLGSRKEDLFKSKKTDSLLETFAQLGKNLETARAAISKQNTQVELMGFSRPAALWDEELIKKQWNVSFSILQSQIREGDSEEARKTMSALRDSLEAKTEKGKREFILAHPNLIKERDRIKRELEQVVFPRKKK